MKKTFHCQVFAEQVYFILKNPPIIVTPLLQEPQQDNPHVAFLFWTAHLLSLSLSSRPGNSLHQPYQHLCVGKLFWSTCLPPSSVIYGSMLSDPKVPADLRHSSPELRPRAFSMQLIDSRWRPAGLTPVSAHEAVNLCMGETSLYPNISSFLPPRLRNLKKYKSLAFIAKRKDTVNRLWWCLDRLQRTVGSKRSRQGMAGLSDTGDNPASSDGTEWIFLFVVLHFCVFL